MKLRTLLLALAAVACASAAFFLGHPYLVNAESEQLGPPPPPRVVGAGCATFVGMLQRAGEPGWYCTSELDFPYYNLRDGFQSTLLLVSDSPKPMDFTLGVRASTGQMLTTSETVSPGAKLSIDLASVITQLGGDPTGVFAEGSVAVYYMGTIMPIVGQISIHNPQLSLEHESEMVENDPGRSDVPAMLNGVWWGIGGGRQAQVMVTNIGGDPAVAEVRLDFQGKQHPLATPLTFAPGETKVLDIAQLLASIGANPQSAPEGGITITQAGPHPSLIANGKITDPATGFSSTMDFPLPELERVSALHAKDSPFAGTGTFVPRVVVRNLAGAPQNVTITVEYPVDSLLVVNRCCDQATAA